MMRRRYTYRTLKQLGRFAVPAVGLGVVGYLLISGAIPTRSRVLDMLDLPALVALVGSALGHLVDAFWSYYEISDGSLRICKVNLGTQNVNAVVPWDSVVFGGVTGGDLRLILSGKSFTIPSRVSDFDDLTREIRIRATGKLPDASSDLMLKVKSEETARLIIWEIQQDMKINAIKRYRDATGAPLKQAKDDVESIALALKFAPDHGGGAPAALPLAPGVACDEATLARVASELAAGRKINAIKILRDATRMGLKDAKDYVERMERDGLPGAPSAPAAVVAPRPRGTLSESAMARVQDEIRRDHPIMAVKIVREETGMGLMEAKKFVEDLHGRMT